MKYLLLPLILLALLPACDSTTEESSIRNKPSSVPESAFWVGGSDGGVYVFIEKLQNNIYRSEIYNESGEAEYKGKLQLLPPGALEYTNKSIFQGWDGDTLYLSEDRRLVIP
ncbi:hypothetical protein [Oceanobacter kriegii]|uniref:hypothetical protein n=1 Tax=Oceanobacter kriegii TaxID=64972 RepID=UPI00048869FA|nr:hypothetical protein [Oceanobacter kriegii]